MEKRTTYLPRERVALSQIKKGTEIATVGNAATANAVERNVVIAEETNAVSVRNAGNAESAESAGIVESVESVGNVGNAETNAASAVTVRTAGTAQTVGSAEIGPIAAIEAIEAIAGTEAIGIDAAIVTVRVERKIETGNAAANKQYITIKKNVCRDFCPSCC